MTCRFGYMASVMFYDTTTSMADICSPEDIFESKNDSASTGRVRSLSAMRLQHKRRCKVDGANTSNKLSKGDTEAATQWPNENMAFLHYEDQLRVQASVVSKRSVFPAIFDESKVYGPSTANPQKIACDY
jgi:hypothetical protein